MTSAKAQPPAPAAAPLLPPGTGIPSLDSLLHGLILGDNVVLHVDRIDDYLPFVQPYVDQAVRQDRQFIYFRFARHPQLLPNNTPGVRRVELDPEVGFESFVAAVVDTIEAAGLEAFYLFDSLSELAVDWFSDRMLANFFMIVCPFLYRLDTIAYFALMKKRHSATAVDGIRNTAQVVVDIFRHDGRLYVQPCKADGRYSPTLFTLHEWQPDGFRSVASSFTVAAVLAQTPQPWLEFSTSRPGTWQEQFMRARQLLDRARAGVATREEIDACFEKLMRMALTREHRFQELVRQYFTLEDLVRVLGRMIGTGLIGGKSLGMLLARAILGRNCPAAAGVLEPHDSFFVGSDVFYTHLVRNDCWWLRRGNCLDDRLANAELARQRILAGQFSPIILQQFVEMLDYFGQSPLIVRSSSLLEDNYGNAFSGKYDSVFCPNQGTPAQRLEAFLAAVRQVYASSLSRDALVYRARSGLLEQDEQMALLVQRVSGYRSNTIFLPHIGGVGFSFNAYAWHRDIEPAAGMLRLVVGLGTRAVDRTDDDHATLVALNAPLVQPPAVAEDPKRYSQRLVDVVDLENDRMAEIPFEKLIAEAPDFPLHALATLDQETLERIRAAGMNDESLAWLPNFAPLLRQPAFVATMRELLQRLEQAYDNPVDIEFTVNLIDQQQFRVNLVQCRPFQVKVKKATDLATMANPPANAHPLLRCAGPLIGPSLAVELDRVVYVVPAAYAKLSMADRYAVARLIGRITRLESDDQEPTIMLIGPGRWGTSTPALGVPVSFAEIERATVIVEFAVMHDGLVPDVSLGTHFFNDLVELDMLYLAICPGRDGNLVDREFFEKTAENRLPELLPDAAGLAAVVRVVDRAPNGQPLRLHADTRRQQAIAFVADR